MRKLLTVITALLLLVNSFSFYVEAAEQLPDSDHFPQTPSAAVTRGNSIGSAILVGLHLGAAATDLDTTLSSVDVQSLEPLFPDAPIETALSRIFRLRLASTSDVPSTLARLMVHPSVDYAEVDQVAHTVTTTPNDPLLPGQWALPQISAPTAWDVITGTPTVVIAMLDTGIDVDHPDLIGQLWSNPGETPNNGIDDDNNGYIDDVHGWNFIAQTNEVDDDDGHGTKVAGVAVAETNNGVGVAGVCWNCRIMVVKVVQPGGFANYSDIALGVYYAVSKGADVINISLGGAADSATLRAAVEAATETAVVVAAVGDGNTSTQFYPAAYPDVLAVGGTTAADTRASFSNYGQWVDVAAPAVIITTTLNGGNYGPASGTSMAAPFVSGLAGLVSSQHPDWTPSLVQSQIVHTTDAIAATGLGSGRINAAAAVTQIPRPLLTIASTAINDDALGHPTPGEGASLMINLENDWLDATAVTGVLSTTDPYATITNNTAAFGDIPAGETGSGGSVYSFTVASGAGYNYPIAFTLHLSANSEAYAVTLPLTITTRSANQIVGGTIVTHTVWTSDKTYIVNNNVGVAPGISLTIQPGTVVRFNDNYGLNIGGTLVADGTQAQPIRFMSNSGSTWGRILFDDLSIDATATVSGTYLGGNILRWVWVESAGQGIGCNNATPYLSHVNLTDGEVNCTPGATTLWVQDTTLANGLTGAGGGQIWRNTITGGGVSLTGQATVLQNHVSGGISTGSNSLIQDNTAGGAINAPGASAVLNNTVSNGGISVGNLGAILENRVTAGDLVAGISTSVMTNTVHEGSISVSSGSLVQDNNVENASGWGISASGTITVTHNRVVGNSSGVNVNGGLVQGNLIANSSGVGLQVGGAYVLSNTITGNGGNALVVASGSPTIQGNNLEFNHSVYDLVNNTANAVVASGNWWGTTESGTISDRIFDYLDDFNLGQVSYAPVLTGPVQDAPAYVRAFTLTPASPVGIETATIGVEFSRQMDTSSLTELDFYTARRGTVVIHPLDGTRDSYGALTLAVHNGKVYAGSRGFRGSSGCSYTGIGFFGVFDIDLETWTLIEIPEESGFPRANAGVSALAIDSVGNRFFAGETPNCIIEDIWVFDTNDEWHMFPLPNSPVRVPVQIWLDTAGNAYVRAQEAQSPYTDTVNVLSTDGIWLPYTGEPYSGSWWSMPGVPQNIDRYNDRWSIDFVDRTVRLIQHYYGYTYSIAETPQWPFSNDYRASYDFTALIPRGAYTLTVGGTLGTDGIEIAPNSTYTFTVDYIGDPETTTPPTPLVRACAALTTTTLSAQWTVPTAQAIGLYRYAIGTAPGRSDVTNWITTTLTSVARTNLNLLPGQTYYVSVRARNTGGIWSDIGASNGVIAGAGGCPQVNFTAAPTSGMAPMPVAFAPQITGTVTSYIWSYGNNITGTQASPVYTYTLPGTYTVTLEVFSPGGWAKVAKEAYISVVPDTVPPSGTLTIAGGGAHIATTTVALTIAASDPSGLDGMRFGNNGTSFSPWVPYNQTYAWTLASGDGPKTVHVQVRDVPGNTATFTSTIILDTTPPTAAVAALPAFTGGTIFTVAWAGSDLYAGVADFDLQVRENTEGIWTDWLTHTTMISAPFTGTHGASYYFRARARDTLGNLGQYTTGNGDTHITIDLLPPVGSVLMNDGAMYTNDLSVRLDLSATDLSGVEAFQLSNDGLAYSEWVSYTTVYSWTLTTGDGIKTVYARFRDMVGHASEAVTDTIILDSTPPEGSIVINEGAEYTNSVSVTLVLSATDFVGITGMALSNDGVAFSEWLSFTSPYSWPLAGSDGIKIVYARFLDPAGNSMTVSDTIMLDRTGPMGSLTIADGATVVPSPTVVLHSDVSDTNGVVEMQFSNDGTSYSGWVAFNSLHTWMLSSGDGEKTVHGRYRDTAGNESSVLSDTVVLDTHAPVGSVLVNDGAMYTHDLNVTLNLSATDLSGVEAFQLSNDGLAYSEWVSYTTVYSWTLTTGDGTKTVYARFRDMVGHASEAATDTIILHTEPPTGSVLIADNVWATVSPSVTLSITATDSLGVAAMCIANDTESCTNWEPFVTWRDWVLQPIDGVRTVTVQVRDLAGVTAVLTDAVLLDTTPPTAAVDSLPPFQTVLDFTVSWSGTDLTEIANFDIQVRQGDQPWSDWLTSTTALSATFTGLDGHTYYFRARARDIPGNLGVYAPGNGDTSTHVDSRRPEGSISIDGGAIDTTSQTVVLLLTTNDATEMAFSDDGVNFSAWEPFATTRLYVLASGDGLKMVSARFRNVVGNVSEYNDSITLNTAIPGDVGVSINNDDPVTEQITVTLTIKAPPNTQYMMVSNSSRFATAEWEPYAATRTWVLAYHPYVTVYPVYVRFRNVDGTVSANYDDIITLHLLEPPPPVDSVPPTGSMVINAGAEETAIQNVLLDVLAADNPGGMGVQWVYFREWKYDPVAVQWVIVRNSGWLPYTENSIAWTLAPGTGVKYIGAWFADGANNVSNPVVIDSINLVLPGDTIGEAQVTQYRRTFEPGQRISMTLTVNNGDADLYIWLPESIAAPDYWSNLPGTATERLAFTAIEGEYLVEVHGYASSVFTLDIATDEGGGGGLGQASATPEQSVSDLTALASKPLPPRPLVITRPGDPVPDESPRQYIYLPLVVRGYQ